MTPVVLTSSKYRPASDEADLAFPTLALAYADPMKGRFPLELAYPRFLQQSVGKRASYKYAAVTEQDHLLAAVLKARQVWPYALTLVHVNEAMGRSDLLALEGDLVRHDLSENVAFVRRELKCPRTEVVPMVLYGELEQMRIVTREEICAKHRGRQQETFSKRLTGVLYSFFA